MVADIISNQENAGKSTMTYQIKETMKIVGKDVEQPALSCTAGGRVQWYCPFKNQFGCFL